MVKNILAPINLTENSRKALHITFSLDSGKESRIDKSKSMDGWATISYRVGVLSHRPVLMVT